MGCGASHLAGGHEHVDGWVTSENTASRSSRAVSSMRSDVLSSTGMLRVIEQEFRDLKEVYAIGRVIGKGQFGTCRVVTHKVTGAKFACKTIAKRDLVSPNAVLDVRREVQIMHHLSGHPNIVSIEEVYEDADHVHLVEELCTGGELFDSIIQRGHYSERDAADAFRCVASVVAHCHNMGVMHRDIKPENFLLSCSSSKAILKGTDFGISVFFTEGQYFKDVVGSAFYLAPEVLLKRYDKRADVWSLGVLLYIMLCGTPPFYAETDRDIFRAILKGELSFAAEPWADISEGAKDVIRSMLDRNPTTRATATEVLYHDWVREDGIAGAAPLHNEVLVRIQNFAALNKLQQEAVKIIATHLPEPEVVGLKSLFSDMDQDGSGTITLDELKQALQRKGTRISADELQHIMAHADISGDGTLDYEEFLAATMHLAKVDRQENLELAFRVFDADASGYITKEELTQVLNKSCSPAEIDALLTQADSSGDGRIDYWEFCDLMKGTAKPALSRSGTHASRSIERPPPPPAATASNPVPQGPSGPFTPRLVCDLSTYTSDMSRLRMESVSQLDCPPLVQAHMRTGQWISDAGTKTSSQSRLSSPLQQQQDDASQRPRQQQQQLLQGERSLVTPPLATAPSCGFSGGVCGGGGGGGAVADTSTRPSSSSCVVATPTPRRLYPASSIKQLQQGGGGGGGEAPRSRSMAAAAIVVATPPLQAPLPRMQPRN